MNQKLQIMLEETITKNMHLQQVCHSFSPPKHQCQLAKHYSSFTTLYPGVKQVLESKNSLNAVITEIASLARVRKYLSTLSTLHSGSVQYEISNIITIIIFRFCNLLISLSFMVHALPKIALRSIFYTTQILNFSPTSNGTSNPHHNLNPNPNISLSLILILTPTLP